MTPFFVMVFDLISSFTNEKKSQVRKKSGPAKEVLGVKSFRLCYSLHICLKKAKESH